jgi:hypothetical protein
MDPAGLTHLCWGHNLNVKCRLQSQINAFVRASWHALMYVVIHRPQHQVCMIWVCSELSSLLSCACSYEPGSMLPFGSSCSLECDGCYEQVLDRQKVYTHLGNSITLHAVSLVSVCATSWRVITCQHRATHRFADQAMRCAFKCVAVNASLHRASSSYSGGGGGRCNYSALSTRAPVPNPLCRTRATLGLPSCGSL